MSGNQAPTVEVPIDPYLMGVNVAVLADTAQAFNDLQSGIRGPWYYGNRGGRVFNTVDRALRFQGVAYHAGRLLDQVAPYDNPYDPFANELGVVREALRTEVVAQAEQSPTALSITRALGAVVCRVTGPSETETLPTPTIRTALDIYYAHSGRTPRDITAKFTGSTVLKKWGFRKTVPNDVLAATAAPEILELLGFTSDDPLVQGALQHPVWTRRFAGQKVEAIRRQGAKIMRSLPQILQSGVLLKRIVDPVTAGFQASGLTLEGSTALRQRFNKRHFSDEDYYW